MGIRTKLGPGRTLTNEGSPLGMSVCVDHKSISQHAVVTRSRAMHTVALAYGKESSASPHGVPAPESSVGSLSPPVFWHPRPEPTATLWAGGSFKGHLDFLPLTLTWSPFS